MPTIASLLGQQEMAVSPHSKGAKGSHGIITTGYTVSLEGPFGISVLFSKWKGVGRRCLQSLPISQRPFLGFLVLKT